MESALLSESKLKSCLLFSLFKIQYASELDVLHNLKHLMGWGEKKKKRLTASPFWVEEWQMYNFKSSALIPCTISKGFSPLGVCWIEISWRVALKAALREAAAPNAWQGREGQLQKVI